MSQETLSLPSQPRASVAIACWGAFGVIAVLAQAVWRLTPLALEPIQKNMLSRGQLALYAFWVVFNLYTEGYRAFQLRFAPRVVVRALHLARNPRPLHVALAPAFCMALFHATRKRLIVSWVTTLAIIAVVIAVRSLPQPWRGIIDGGVVVGLAWGIGAILYHLARALGGQDLGISADVPET